MKSSRSQYIFGALFFAIGIYQLAVRDMAEFSLYAVAGSAFIVNALSMEPRFQRHKKALAIVSWLLIFATGLIFLFMLQFKYL